MEQIFKASHLSIVSRYYSRLFRAFEQKQNHLSLNKLDKKLGSFESSNIRRSSNSLFLLETSNFNFQIKENFIPFELTHHFIASGKTHNSLLDPLRSAPPSRATFLLTQNSFLYKAAFIFLSPFKKFFF